MTMSIPQIAREYAPYINIELEHFNQSLHPSSTEDEELVRRASFAVRNKSVLLERFIPFSETLYAIVQDVRSAEVRIDFQEEKIYCSCRQTEHCRHKLAVLLALFQQFDSAQEWASNWRAKRNVQLHALASARSPENWQRMVDEVMDHLLKADTKMESYFIPSIIENARAKLKRHVPFEREWQPLYKLFIELAMLNRLWAHLNKTNSSVTSDYFEYFVEKTYDQVTQYTLELENKSRLFATDPFYNALQEQVRELLLQEKGLIPLRLNFYLLLWDNIFTEKQRAQNELAIIEKLNIKTDLSIALLPAIFHIILKDYNALQTVVEHIEVIHLNEIFTMASFALKNQDKHATSILLIAALPFLHEFINTEVSPSHRQMFTNFANDLFTGIDITTAQELMLYSAFGKYGVRPYSDYLLRVERYDDWAALHQLYPTSIAHLEACGLKQVLLEAPEVTLALYHHYALEEIRQKSRMNYKQAVRIWKSMKNAAKKAGKTTYFENYMQIIQQQYKRLRALQEEIDKSNLIM